MNINFFAFLSVKTGPSITDAAVGRIAHSTKVLAEGGYEKIFTNNFETVPDEKLVNSFACYLSTSAGPVMGVLYISTAKIAFCSDNPLSYKVGDQTEYRFYKVLLVLLIYLILVETLCEIVFLIMLITLYSNLL